MKRKELLKLIVGVTVVAVLAIALPLAGGCAPKAAAPAPGEPAPGAVTYHLRMQTVYPPIQTTEMFRPWLDTIEEATGGQLEFELYSAGEIVPNEELLQACVAGTVDCCLGGAATTAFPLGVIDLDNWAPFTWVSHAELLTIMEQRGLEDIFAESYKDAHLHYVGFICADPITVLSRKPIQRYEDFNGLKMDAYEAVASVFEEAGVTSVVLPVEEYYLAGSTGTLDALCWCGAKEGSSNKWYEVFPYFLDPPICGAAFNHFLFNEEVWNSFPSDIQTTLELAVDALVVITATYYYEGELEGREYFEITTLPEEDWAKLRASALEHWDEVAEENPKCAQALDIIKAYNAEADAAKYFR